MLTTVLIWTGTTFALALLTLMVLPAALDHTGDTTPARDARGAVLPALLDTHADRPAKPTRHPRPATAHRAPRPATA
ncbi:hypothetical protein JOF53_007907 [Crossiella equi]|uniref:Uncharacterized protein n=1 Tax=Crossiella equi TaxID=130796 RepID=A0ABS5ATM3_9PSEU|nr:hypothetical protein [Crossiella equi]MBP2479035.1 hypothetical protein [Crossiella equi]